MSHPTPQVPRSTTRRTKRLAVSALAVLAAMTLTAVRPGVATAEPAEPAGPAVPSDGALAAPISPEDRVALLKEAADGVAETAKALKLDPQEGLQVRDAARDRDGTTHFRYNRTFAGLPVLGGDLIVHRSPQGVLSDTRAHEASIGVPSTTPAIAADRVMRETSAKAEPRLVVWAAAGNPTLAWEATVEGSQEDGTPSERHIVTDAKSGERLYEYEAVRTGVGQGQYSGTVTIGTRKGTLAYEMNDVARGGHRTYNMRNLNFGQGSLFTDQDDTWGNGSQSNAQTAGVDAHYGAAETWDYYKEMHGRSGIRGDGVGARSRVHAGNNYKNAFWNNDCFCMTYGDGANNARPLTELDVAGHEMTHGLTFATAGLQYSHESGGLNEATSDIFGTAVEFYANNPKDVPDYFMGELINLNGNGTPLRYLDRPSRDGVSPDYWYPGLGSVDVHYSSGPANHFFYLLAEGSGQKTINGIAYDSPTYDGKAVPGIGRTKAERIWYRALTTYMTSTTDYAGARRATLQATADLFGATGTEYATVAATWDAVNVQG